MWNMQSEIENPRTELTELIVRTGRRMRTVFNARVSALGLTYPRARVLAMLARHAAPNQTELAGRLQLETATVVRLLDGMERLGLVERVPADGDRRAKEVRLTPEGRDAAAQVAAITQDIREAMLDGIGDADAASALHTMRHMARSIEDMAAGREDVCDEE